MSEAAWRRMDIVFIRHAESANNTTWGTVREKFGDTLSPEQFEEECCKLHNADPGLSTKGLAQADKLKEFISAGGLTEVAKPEDWKIYSSPMYRCMLTNKAVADGFKQPATVKAFLFESDGCYRTLPGGGTQGEPGMKASEVEETFPGFTCVPGEMENGWYTGTKKETRKEFLDRAQKIADWLWVLQAQSVEERGFKTGVVLTVHGNLIGAILSCLMNTDSLIASDNTGVSHLQLWSDSNGGSDTSTGRRIPSLHYVNKVDHLRDTPELISGSDIFGTNWMQEFIMPKV